MEVKLDTRSTAELLGVLKLFKEKTGGEDTIMIGGNTYETRTLNKTSDNFTLLNELGSITLSLDDFNDFNRIGRMLRAIKEEES